MTVLFGKICLTMLVSIMLTYVYDPAHAKTMNATTKRIKHHPIKFNTPGNHCARSITTITNKRN
jgi:hypothetical protein